MPNSPVINEFYNNTSFSTEENTSLKSSFLGFGQTLSIAFNLLKKRISNLFLSVLIWQLVLFILFLIVEAMLFFGISRSYPQSSQVYIYNPIDPKTYEISKEFINAVSGILTNPVVIGFAIMMVLVLVVYALISKWIEFKSSVMINNIQFQLFDNNRFLKKFWILTLFLICYSIVTSIVSGIFDVKGSAVLNFVLGVASFIFSFVIVYTSIIVEYISNIYLIEERDFWDSFRIILNNINKLWLRDFFRHLIFMIIVGAFAIFGFFLFTGISFGLLFPLTDSNTVSGITGITLLILFALVLFLVMVCILALSWLVQAFTYVAYYNLRMLDLHNITTSDSYNNLPKIVDNTELTQTLEEKLMQNNNIETAVEERSPFQNKTEIADIKPLAETEMLSEELLDQKNEATKEYDLMDVKEKLSDIIETKPELTIINPNHTNIIGLANIKKSKSAKYVDDETAVTKNPIFSTIENDNLQIIEGIGPKIEELLQNNNIKTFAKLADTSVEDLKAILEKAGNLFSIHNPLNWPRQAVLAREGKIEELEILKEKLVRGV